jgi:hypothetical protein
VKRNIVVLVAIMAIACWAGAAGADTAIYYLTVPNTYYGYDAPYGQVTVTLESSGTVANFRYSTVDPSPPLSVYNDFNDINPGYSLVATYMAAIHVNGTVTYSNSDIKGYDQNGTEIHSTKYVFTTSAGGAQGVFGAMNLAINGPNDNGNDTTDTDILTFKITKASGAWTGVASGSTPLLTPTTQGYLLEGHLFPDWLEDLGGLSFYAGNGTYTPVPVPPSALLLGSGFLGLVGWRQFRKS